MKIYYKNELLFENIPSELVDKTINDFILTKNKEYFGLYDRTEALINKIETIRPRKTIELISEYNIFLTKEYPLVLKEIENIGRTLYKENFIDIFFYNSLCSLVGFTVKNDLQYREDVFLIPLLLEIIMMCPIKHLFKIEED